MRDRICRRCRCRCATRPRDAGWTESESAMREGERAAAERGSQCYRARSPKRRSGGLEGVVRGSLGELVHLGAVQVGIEPAPTHQIAVLALVDDLSVCLL